MSIRSQPLCPRCPSGRGFPWTMRPLKYIRPLDDVPPCDLSLTGGCSSNFGMGQDCTVKTGGLTYLIRPMCRSLLFPRVARKAPGVTQDYASSRCDYLPPVCGPGSGHIGHGGMIQGTCRQRDASSKVTHRPRTSVRRHNGRGHIVIAFLMPWTILYIAETVQCPHRLAFPDILYMVHSALKCYC